MKWNVYYYNINKKMIEIFNIFEHIRFLSDIEKAIKKYKNKEEFAEQLKRDLRYYYGSKAEWEIVISPWVGGDRERDAVKIDVYEQVMNNFDILLDYVWNNKKEFKS